MNSDVVHLGDLLRRHGLHLKKRLDHHQVGVIFKIKRLHMFILEDDLVGR